MFALLSVCHKLRVFIKALKYFQVESSADSQKQLTQPGFCKCFLPVFVCPGSCTNIICRVLGEAGIAYPKILELAPSSGNAACSQDILLSGITGVRGG